MDPFRAFSSRHMCFWLGILLSVAALLGWRWARQPRIEGRPLSFWLVQLGDPDRDPRTIAALAAVPDHSLPALARRLTARDGPMRRALLRLSRAGNGRWFPRMRPADEMRAGAADALAEFGPHATAATPALVEALRITGEEALRNVTGALRRIGQPSLEPLLSLAEDPDSRARARAYTALGLVVEHHGAPAGVAAAIGAKAARDLAHADPAVALGATRLVHLAPAAADAVPNLLANLKHRGSDALRLASAETVGRLATLPEQCVPVLAGALADPAEGVARAAAAALGAFGPDASAAGAALAASLDGPRTRVAVASAYALGRIRTAGGVPELVNGLRHPEAVRRSSCARALGKIRARPDLAVSALATALGDPDAYVRQNAAEALSGFGPEALPAMDALIGALGDRVEPVAMAAAEALGNIGPRAREALPHLQAARNNNQSVMTPSVVAAVEKIRAADAE